MRQGCPEQGGRETAAARRRIYSVFFPFCCLCGLRRCSLWRKGPRRFEKLLNSWKGEYDPLAVRVRALGQVRIWGRTSIVPVRFRFRGVASQRAGTSFSLILVWLVLQPRGRELLTPSQQLEKLLGLLPAPAWPGGASAIVGSSPRLCPPFGTGAPCTEPLPRAAPSELAEVAPRRVAWRIPGVFTAQVTVSDVSPELLRVFAVPAPPLRHLPAEQTR